jgi:hypothetical protein
VSAVVTQPLDVASAPYASSVETPSRPRESSVVVRPPHEPRDSTFAARDSSSSTGDAQLAFLRPHPPLPRRLALGLRRRCVARLPLQLDALPRLRRGKLAFYMGKPLLVTEYGKFLWEGL